MNELSRAELRRLAEAATGGDWEFRLGLIRTMADSDGYVPVAIAPNCPKNWRGQRDTNMEYIAAANPAAVLSLLDQCDGLMAQHARDSVELSNQCHARDVARRERDAALAELEAYKSQLRALIHISDATNWEQHTCGEISKARELLEKHQ